MREIIGGDGAMRSGGDMKSFFREQKAHTNVATKPTGGVSKKAARHHQKPAAAAVHLHPSTPDHGNDVDPRRRQEGEEDWERAAREFDMDMRYGPCLGLTRASMRGGGRRGRRTGKGRLGSSTWTCATGNDLFLRLASLSSVIIAENIYRFGDARSLFVGTPT